MGGDDGDRVCAGTGTGARIRSVLSSKRLRGLTRARIDFSPAMNEFDILSGTLPRCDPPSNYRSNLMP